MKTFITILTILGFAFGAYFYIENRYALSQELEKTKQRLEYKIVGDQIQSIQDRIWKIIDRFQKKEMDETTKEELRSLEVNKEKLNDKLKALEK